MGEAGKAELNDQIQAETTTTGDPDSPFANPDMVVAEAEYVRSLNTRSTPHCCNPTRDHTCPWT